MTNEDSYRPGENKEALVHAEKAGEDTVTLQRDAATEARAAMVILRKDAATEVRAAMAILQKDAVTEVLAAMAILQRDAAMVRASLSEPERVPVRDASLQEGNRPNRSARPLQ